MIDLREELPELLPHAIVWAQAQEQAILHVGQQLNQEGLEVARRVGVRWPERIRVYLVDQIPKPEGARLREAAEQTGLFDPDIEGMTFGYGIYLIQGKESVQLLSHECRHVYQYETLGGIEGFLPVYLEQVVTMDYESAPLEQDARAHEIHGGKFMGVEAVNGVFPGE